MTIKSPITGESTSLVSKISTNKIIEDYKKQFHIDTSKFFKDVSDLYIYKCDKTKYRFYYPQTISGDSSFYEHFQKYRWYYMPWKWEHDQAIKYIKKDFKVLEVGCARGNFLTKIHNEIGCSCVGLEFNNGVVEEAKLSGIEIINTSIQDYSKINKEAFDIVCSFQVLEHVYDVKEFIQAQLDCLKKGGKLIISIPNNDSFLGISYNLLNLPPHHMGLWNVKSVKKLSKIFNLKFESLSLEPLQSYHNEYFRNTVNEYISSKWYIPQRFVSKCARIYILFASKKFKAFTIQIVYSKL